MKRWLIQSFILVIILSVVITSTSFNQIVYAANSYSSLNESAAHSYLIKYKDVEKGKKDLIKNNKKINRSFTHFPIITSSLTDADAEQLRKDMNVEYIERDSTVQKTADVIPTNLTQIHALDAQEQGLTGSGIKVAVLDTGIDKESVELNIVDGISFVPTETNYDDLNGHGTFVAGVIAALKDNQGLIGVSPEVDLYAVKVLDKHGNGTYSQVIEAIEWAIDHQIDIVNMSFEGTQFSYALQEVMQLAYHAGILLVSSTGNEGATNSIGYPAKYASVIAVGAVNDSNQLASFSNTGEEVELVAPGVGIEGLSLTSSYITFSGTSIATPHVAGVAALIKHNYPTYTNEEIRQMLTQTAIPLGDSLAYGFGLVDARSAIQAYSVGSTEKKKSGKKIQEIKGSAAVRTQQFITEHGVTQEFIQAELDKGYTLEEVGKALGLKKNDNKLTYEQSIGTIKKRPVNKSREVESTIENTASFSVMSTTEDPIQHVNTKPSEAPFSVNLDNETISTLSGSLVIGGSDMTLPGRNGLSFTLSRTYESGSSQFYPLDYTTGKTMEEKLFPIGKGWSWNISFIEITGTKKYLHLSGAGTYEIDGTTLKGYPWSDITFSTDTTVTVNSLTSAFAVKSIHNVSQYFTSDGKLIQISDAYNNRIQFHYSTQGNYGSVLSSIIDAIGNTINITYTESKVTITQGAQTVTYIKKIENSKELLSKVWDSLNRATTYDYAISTAKYNLQGTTPNQDNPYALITGVTFPTGGKSVYTYDTAPITRYIGSNMVNQAYRIKTRENQILFTDGTSEVKNQKTITYTGDMASADAVDLTFSATINDGRSISVFDNKKDYVDANTTAAFYNTKVTSTAGTMKTTTDYTYDEARRIDAPIRIESKNVNTVTLAQSTPVVTVQTYDDYGNVTSSVNPLNVMSTYEFDPTTHWLKSSSEPASATQTRYTGYTYNVQGDVIQVDVKEANSTGTLLQQIKYEDFDIYGNIRRVRVKDDTRDLITLYEYGAAYQGAFPTKQSVSVTNVDSVATTIASSYEYNAANGNLTKAIDGKGYATQYQYDALGRVTKTIHPDLSTISVAYDDFNNILTLTDEVGIISIAKWNPLGWKTEAGLNEGGIYKAKEKYGYDQFGRAIWSEDAIGNRTNVGYDLWNRQTLVTYADTYTSSVIYDDINNKKTGVDPENNKARETYDILGRVIKSEEIKPNGATTIVGEYTYNHSGNVLDQKDAKQQSTNFGYNTLSQLTSVTNAKLETTQYSYSMAGNMKQMTHPDLTIIQKQYDELGRVIKEIDGEAHIDKYYYDANSNMSKRIDRKGHEFTFVYNNRNFLLQKISTDETIGFTYDNSGKRLTMTDSTGTTTNTYNPHTSGLNQVTYPDGRTIQYDYDTQGQRRQMTDPFGGNVYYSYDARNRLSGVGTAYQDYDAEYTYFKNGQLSQIQQKNGVTSTYAYDGLRLDTLVHTKADSTILSSYDYGYDPNGNITSRIDAGTTKAFTYDPLNRINTSSQFAETYAYDNRGNRDSLERNKLFENTNTNLVYDDRDRLEQVTTADGKVVSYTYNGDNLLYERTENGETTRYYYDGGSIIAEATVVNGVAELKQRYIRGRGLIASEDPYFNKAYYLHNGHGDVEQLRDDTGNTRLNNYSYDIWGNPVIEEETIHNPFRYSGELWDDTTSLQYLRARWYDPSEGRFINEDSYEGSLTNPLSLNLYTYVENNPLIYIDPTGNYKMSDNDELKSMVEMFGNQWQDANKIGDKAGMIAAEKAADAVRVSYYSLQSKGLPSDVKYTDKGLEDVTDRLNGLMLRYEYVYEDRSSLDIKEFYELVRNGAELDLKNQGWTSPYYVYNKQIVEKDVPGNISFGYVGKVFDIPDTILVAGAGLAQIRAGTYKREWVNLTSFGDDPRDTYWINYGIDLYISWHRK